MDLGLEDKVVVITGGASNIGRAISLAFGGEGATVIIADMDEKKANEVVDKIKAKKTNAIEVKTDITDRDNVQKTMKKVVDEFGKIDALINNVGWVSDQLFMKEDSKKWERMININLKGNIYCTRAALEYMIEQNSGCIVSISSDAGKIGEYREAVYSACKAGTIAFMKSIAKEVGRYGIRANAVCPGLVVPRTEEEVGGESMWRGGMKKLFTPEIIEKAKKAYPLRKLTKADDVARAVLFIASERCAGDITGQSLSVDGGYAMV
ncbi:MAG: SDR family oxidoreductase [Candidatus Methanolliviera hydrocarbonicum]|uniref:SDR family oxidoreductase n=1 Tax=Candidatus Methanolliviera hydrocarbonicum TaxID=2491085 RepID=A0A520KU97_9EURY|nr:MAG: SDR family oxidoreductase [Candidatus Methanolliviera hydrocarbonicum]